MTQEEIKSRNIALATYMGWEPWESSGFYTPEPVDGVHKFYRSENLLFHEDMNWLMPVVWKLMGDGWRITDLRHCGPHPVKGHPDPYHCELAKGPGKEKVQSLYSWGESPALALWEAVSSLVMELQKKAV